MAGVYYGAVFGGSTSSILLNAPGVPGTVATSFDGYPMAQQGKAGKALAIAAWSSFAGGTLAAIYLLFLAPSLSKVSLSFRSPDYFALMILGLTAIAAFSSKGQFIKAMMMVVLGLMLASVGQDSLSDITRFTFNNMNLTDGISFVLVVMATFAMSEALTIILKRNDPTAAAKQVSLTELGSIRINKEERKKMLKTIPRTSIIGFIIGVLPGAGATIASFLAYGMERNLVSDEEKEKLEFFEFPLVLKYDMHHITKKINIVNIRKFYTEKNDKKILDELYKYYTFNCNKLYFKRNTKRLSICWSNSHSVSFGSARRIYIAISDIFVKTNPKKQTRKHHSINHNYNLSLGLCNFGGTFVICSSFGNYVFICCSRNVFEQEH